MYAKENDYKKRFKEQVESFDKLIKKEHDYLVYAIDRGTNEKEFENFLLELSQFDKEAKEKYGDNLINYSAKYGIYIVKDDDKYNVISPYQYDICESFRDAEAMLGMHCAKMYIRDVDKFN